MTTWLTPAQLRHFQFGTEEHVLLSVSGGRTSGLMLWAVLQAYGGVLPDNIHIRSTDALKLIDDYDTADCLLFVDPPYPGDVGRRYAVRMNEEAHRSLAERLKRAKASVILTMNPGTIYSEVLGNWVEHHVAVTGGGNATKGEVILTNFEPLPLLAGGAA